ncbi:hypothetical protein LV84_01350 [Algoriphagus ratkowskyi]|uniref:Uncharacterized protein n=1 Tax=Algoriphagus ratkowskyi TaxID=57028 RepID=A0A2W7RXK2_9BACT|nr:hypothetical protein LV84_01350 [Algoriphagus ratkowskyi]
MDKTKKWENLSPEKLQEIFNKHGEEITIEKSTKILELIERFSKLCISQLLKV